MRRVGLALGAAVATGLGAIAATICVGARVREDTVVEQPYEDGLRQDAERAARGALGASVSLVDEAPAVGDGPLRFALVDRAGGPLEGVAVSVGITRSETSRGGGRAVARAEGGGRFVADLGFPAPGPWDVRFDVVRGADRVRLERRVVVRAACDLAAGPCARPLAGGGEARLELSPRPLRTMRELAVRVELRPASTSIPTPTSTSTATPVDDSLSPRQSRGERVRVRGADAPVSVSFLMPGMDMGENRAALAAAGPDVWEGTAVLVRCPSGRSDWVAELSLPDGATARFPFTVREER